MSNNTSFLNKITKNKTNKNASQTINMAKNIAKKYMSITKNNLTSVGNNLTSVGNNQNISLGGMIFLFILVLIVFYLLYKYYQKYKINDLLNPVIVPDPIDMKNIPTDYKQPLPPYKSNSKLVIGSGISLSYSLWVYVKDWNITQEDKTIFMRTKPKQGTSTDNNSGMFLDKQDNTLRILTNIMNTTDPDTADTIQIERFPLQKWTHIVYVLNGVVADVYINGKLVYSKLLSGIPDLNENDRIQLYEDTSYVGQLSRFKYYSNILHPSDILNIYSDGPY